MPMETTCLLIKFISKSIQDTLSIIGIQHKVFNKSIICLFRYKGCLQANWWLSFPRKQPQTLVSHFIFTRISVLPTLLKLRFLEDQMKSDKSFRIIDSLIDCDYLCWFIITRNQKALHWLKHFKAEFLTLCIRTTYIKISRRAY